jgi:hypothetical protein
MIQTYCILFLFQSLTLYLYAFPSAFSSYLFLFLFPDMISTFLSLFCWQFIPANYFPVFICNPIQHTECGAHLPSYPMGTRGSPLGGKAAGA